MTLDIRNLSLSIHGTPILDNVSLQIAAGEIGAVTGESGSGKSMTALSVMQLLPPGSDLTGTIHLDETEITAQTEAQMCALRGNDIAMIFQEPMTALNPVKSIGDQVAETLLIHRAASRAEAYDRAKDTLARVGLDQPLSRFPHELSGGQRQRVGIAMAIALRPKLLIADEPTTALDVTTQAQILDLLTRLVREDGMAMLMITHDLAVVADMADRIAVMQAGRIVEEGPTAELLAEMRHPYTRALFAASDHRADLPPMTGATDAILTADAVTRAYPLPRRLFQPRGYVTAVNDVSFTIHAGERVGLVGESGCGKSTLTRALLGLEPLQGGRIAAFGHGVGPDLPAAMRLGMQVVFQDPYGSFNPRHRVARLITEPFHLLPDPPTGADRQKAIDGALTAVGLKPSDADKFIHEFSGGQRQRIAIARALIIRPELIIFDEAVSALDVRVRAQILDLIADLARATNLAYLFISHDLSVVRGITDRVMVMKAGRIVEDGPTDVVLEEPSHPYTRSLLDAAPRLPQIAGLNA
ncbi:ABC transporter ATP-binding protein [Pseudaestuariivita atlantica]|uniref:Microcin ABC transporter ATP-binding protein n=1 Tax=Pseudaestuariivita atlantica TaxID=1317121 RepID=A0A0L1JR94_9RHOB|nr:ABC transporter ATP-binding protein [Pseudaestuariivita atlantica]KNG94265.1 microcin ABC transporter ATP-binding protein [Pseudaestuariivita atlantica]